MFQVDSKIERGTQSKECNFGVGCSSVVGNQKEMGRGLLNEDNFLHFILTKHLATASHPDDPKLPKPFQFDKIGICC